MFYSRALNRVRRTTPRAASPAAPIASTAAGSGTGATDTVLPVTSWSKPVPFPYTNVPVLGGSENTIVSAPAWGVW